MRSGCKIDGAVAKAVAGLVLIACAHLASGQAMQSPATGSRILISSPGPVQVSPVAAGDVVREIDDPHSGTRWLLVYDSTHPGGPGRLVPVSGASMNSANSTDQRNPADAKEPMGLSKAGSEVETPAPVIRVGDRVIVERDTPIVDERLEAMAMGPAQAGSTFNARLTIGGKVVHVVAVGPGRAAFQKEPGQ
jgi:hypothetical protein